MPSLKGEKVVWSHNLLKKSYLKIVLCLQASRAQILKKTTEYIQKMRVRIATNQKDVEDIKKQNAILEAQSRFFSNLLNC